MILSRTGVSERGGGGVPLYIFTNSTTAVSVYSVLQYLRAIKNAGAGKLFIFHFTQQEPRKWTHCFGVSCSLDRYCCWQVNTGVL